jgi:hypothetical protein
METFPCPKCGRNLKQSGEVSIPETGKVFPSYQCDECIMTLPVGGEEMELPLTFLVNGNGVPFNPSLPGDGILKF